MAFACSQIQCNIMTISIYLFSERASFFSQFQGSVDHFFTELCSEETESDLVVFAIAVQTIKPRLKSCLFPL